MTRSVVFILGLLIGYEIRDIRRAIPFCIEAYNDIKSFVNGEYIIADLTCDGDDDE